MNRNWRFARNANIYTDLGHNPSSQLGKNRSLQRVGPPLALTHTAEMLGVVVVLTLLLTLMICYPL